MSRDAALLSLQQTDDLIDALAAERTAAEARIASDAAVEAADAAHATQAGHVEVMEREQRRLDAELADLGSRIERDETRLYSGTITSMKEMESLQQEVQSLKERRGRLEEETLTLMGDLEQEQATLAELVNARDRERRRWAEDSATLRQRIETIAGELAGAEETRQGYRAGIDPGSLATYETLRTRRGVAIARLRGSTCSACRVQIPDAVRRHVLDASILARCPNCERILVFGS